MKDLKSIIRTRGGGFCATLPKSVLDIFRIPLKTEFDIEVKTIKGIKTIILREVK